MKYPCIDSLLTVFLEINATSLQKLDRIDNIPIFKKIKLTEFELSDAICHFICLDFPYYQGITLE